MKKPSRLFIALISTVLFLFFVYVIGTPNADSGLREFFKNLLQPYSVRISASVMILSWGSVMMQYIKRTGFFDLEIENSKIGFLYILGSIMHVIISGFIFVYWTSRFHNFASLSTMYFFGIFIIGIFWTIAMITHIPVTKWIRA